MRSKFEIQMGEIHKELVQMGSLVESALEAALSALTEGDEVCVEQTHEYEYKIDEKEREIEHQCMRLLLTQQPVAGDLRLISAALKMITDMERIGDQAQDIADIAANLDRSLDFDRDVIQNMFNAALLMVRRSIDSFIRADLELAKSVILSDDIVDGYFVEIRNRLIARIKSFPDAGEQLLDLLMAVKYLERIGDHATNIAEWVIYSITGKHERISDPQK